MSDVTHLRYASLDIPGLPSHRVILDSFFCGGTLVATREPGVNFAEAQDEHFRAAHGITDPISTGHRPRMDFAYEIGTRDGEPVISTRLHKTRGWNNHYGDPEGPSVRFTGRSFKCGCGFKSAVARPGEPYPPIDHPCNYDKYQGWRISRDELDEERVESDPDELSGMEVDPDNLDIVTRAVVRLPTPFEYSIVTTDTDYELRLPTAECTLTVENKGVTTDRRVLRGINVKAPRELRVPHPGELDLFRPWLNGGVGWSANGVVQAVLPNQWQDVSFSADEVIVDLGCP